LYHLDTFAIPMPKHVESSLEEAYSTLVALGGEVTPELRTFTETVWAGEIPETFPLELSEEDFGNRMAHFALSSFLQSRGYYARATKVFANTVAEENLGTILDPFAGSGYMVKAFREAGIPTIGTDDDSWGFEGPFEKLNALESLRKHGNEVNTVLFAWTPPLDTVDLELYQLMKRDYPHLNALVISEGPHGCTGSVEFAELHKSWPTLYNYETSWALRDYCAVSRSGEL